MDSEINIPTNEFQTPITKELLESLPGEVSTQLVDYINNVPYIRYLISPNRKRACDLERDKDGKIIVDLAHPHILENMDYFRQTAIHFEKHGVYTDLQPNGNPNSSYGKFVRREIDRCLNGMIRPSDGEWITGQMYYFLNYSIMELTKYKKGSKQAFRKIDFPEVWEGIYLRSHYLYQARYGGKYNSFLGGNHAAELASRGKGKSYYLSSILSHNFIFGESYEASKNIVSIIVAYLKEYLSTKDGTLGKFLNTINFCAEYTQFPRRRLIDSIINMTWKMGYKDPELNIDKGTLNTVLGVTTNDDVAKIRGKRASFIGIEEFGCHLKGTKVLMYNGNIKNVEDVQIGDILMGDDNTPRNVEQLYNGTDQLYKITLSNGDFQIVNSHHPVFFKKYNWNNNTYTENLLTAPELMNIKNLNKGYYIPKAIINFKEKVVPINPYFLGLWLGDGDSSRLDIANKDFEVIEWLHNNYKGYIRDLKQSDTCKVFHISKKTHIYNKLFIEYNLYNNKHIPQDYKINSSMVQLEVIAGLIDTDGTYNLNKNFFEITQRYDRKHILEDIKFMCECNGLKCSLSTRISTGKKKGILHYRLRISGDLSIIPTKIKRKKGMKVNSYRTKKCWNDYTFKVEPYGIGEYYGFTVNSNHLFVLGDLTITHNTFPNLRHLYNIMQPSVQEGDYVFGLIYMIGCVCAGTKVWTLDGRNINIEQLKKEDGIIGYSELPVVRDNYMFYNDGITRESIGKVIQPAKKECLEITLSNGNSLKCSIDHPILKQFKHTKRLGSYKETNKRRTLFKEQFVRADSLKISDRICECRTINIFGNEQLFDARLVGMLIGDGSYGFNETPKYSSEDEELLTYIKEKYSTSLSNTHITKKLKIYEDIRVKDICSKLKEIGIYGQTKLKKRLPLNYQKLDEQNIKELLSGLYDTDGCYYFKDKNSSITITQSNKSILEEIQILWRKFGVICSIKETKPTLNSNRLDKNPWFTLTITGAINLQKACKVLIPLVFHKKESKNNIEKFFNNYNPNKVKGYNSNYLVYKIVSIKSIGEQVVYNLSACTSRTYLANNIITHNTAGDKESDFAGAKEIMYNPKGYGMYSIPNVYDKENSGKKEFIYFYPGYLNRKGCYDKDGVSDVVKAIIEILTKRHNIKYNSTDPNTLLREIAEIPITPSEAIIKFDANIFPTLDITERINQLDNNINEYNDVYVGDIIFNVNNEPEFKITQETPIREFPHKNNKIAGAIEIYNMPEKTMINGKSVVYKNRYIASLDPVDDDSSETMSLVSIFVLDLWTDKIVCEWTGRLDFAEDAYEKVRKICLFYNAILNYENNKKGLFAYFSRMNCLHLLAPTLEFLKDKDMATTYSSINNKSFGVNATAPLNNFAIRLLRDWLIKPVETMEIIEDKEVITTKANLYTIRNRALLRELSLYNKEGNFDRVSSMLMLMLFREDRIVTLKGNLKKEENDADYLGNDPFFNNNYTDKFNKKIQF